MLGLRHKKSEQNADGGHTTKMKTIGDIKNIFVGRISAFVTAVRGESPVDNFD